MARRANSNTPENARSINLKTEHVSCRGSFRSYCALEKSYYCIQRREGKAREFFHWQSKNPFRHQKGEFLPHTILLSAGVATIYFGDDTTTYKEQKLSLITLWRYTVRAVADHQLQATAALLAGKESPPPDPKMIWTIFGEENLLRLARIETRIVQPAVLSLYCTLKFFVLNCRTFCNRCEPRNGDRAQYPNLHVRRVRIEASCHTASNRDLPNTRENLYRLR